MSFSFEPTYTPMNTHKSNVTLNTVRPRSGCAHALLLALPLLTMVQAQVAAPAGQDLLVLPSFTVTTTQDVGYRAGNSVSATRIDTAIKDLPFTISAFTEQFIEDIGANDLQDILRFAPGVTSGDKSFVAGNNRFSIRGFDGDVPPQRNGFTGNRNVDSANVTRVEVIKGPASLLYGQIIPGGTVNYITKRPEKKRLVTLKQTYGNYDDFRSTVDVNVPLDSRIGLRVIGSYNQDAQWLESGSALTTLIAPSLKIELTKKATLILDYEKLRRTENPPVAMMPNVQIVGLNGNVSNTVWVNLAARSRQQGLLDANAINLGFLAGPPDLYSTFNYAANSDYKKSTYENMNAELNLQLNDHWVARANYSWNTRESLYKFTGLAQWDVTPTAAYRSATLSLFDYLAEYKANPVAVLNDPAKTQSVFLARRKRIQTSGDAFNTYQVDLSGKYDLGAIKLNPLFGAYRQYSRTGGGYTLSSNVNASATGVGSATDPATAFNSWNYLDRSTWDRTTNYDEFSLPVSASGGFTYGQEDAYYAVLTANLFRDRLIVVGGARSDRFRSGGATAFTYEAKKTTPQAGLGYHVTKDSLLFANYSKSFLVDSTSLTVENPAYDPTIPLNTTTNPNFTRVPAKPTTGLGYEVGLKTDFLAGRVSSTVTLFHLERADRTVTVRQPVVGLNASGVLSSTEVSFTKQGTVDQSEGVEFELTYSPKDNWQIYASYAHMSIETTKITATPLRDATNALVSGDYAAYVAGYNEGIALLKGAVPEGSAERLASIWTRYSFKNGALKGLWVAGGGNYTSPKAQRTANPTLFFADYYLWDAAVGYDWKRAKQSWNLALNLKNITDEVYYPANQSRGKPRQFILSVGTKF